MQRRPPGTGRGRGQQRAAFLNAAALQDHFAKSLALPRAKKIRNQEVRPPIRRRRASSSDKPPRDQKSVASRVEEGRTVDNAELFDSPEKNIREYEQRLSLAQKRGLVAKPPQPLTREEWDAARQQCTDRHDTECVICRDPLGLGAQVLLSCSHTFHLHCLESFRRFTQKRVCPMCRREEYQMRVIGDARNEWEVICATRIQAAFRMHRARVEYRAVLAAIPPSKEAPVERRQFYEDRLTGLGDKLLKGIDSDRDSIDAMLADIDRNVLESRSLLANALAFSEQKDINWERVRIRHTSRQAPDCPICLNALYEERDKKEIRGRRDGGRSRARGRGRGRGSAMDGIAKKDPRAKPKPIRLALLSCSHCFHATCLDSFEGFLGDGPHHCPLCRVAYQKLVTDEKYVPVET